jgi:ribosomal protein L33
MLPVSLGCFFFVFLRLLYPLLPVSLDCRETGNIWYTRRRKTKKNNPEKLATYGTQDEEKQKKNNPEKLAT